jgi:hypothetical protein
VSEKKVGNSLVSVIKSLEEQYGGKRSVPEYIKKNNYRAVALALNKALTAIPPIPRYLNNDELNPEHPANRAYWDNLNNK